MIWESGFVYNCKFGKGSKNILPYTKRNLTKDDVIKVKNIVDELIKNTLSIMEEWAKKYTDNYKDRYEQNNKNKKCFFLEFHVYRTVCSQFRLIGYIVCDVRTMIPGWDRTNISARQLTDHVSMGAES